MSTHDLQPVDAAQRGRTALRFGLILSALGFVLFYLSTDFVAPNLASSALPLPNAPVSEAQAWFADNQLAVVTMGLCQLLSVACLAGFVVAFRRSATTDRQVAAVRRATPWGFAAVALMVLCTATSWLLAALAPSAALGTISFLRTVNFILGGTAHVLALGIFILLAAGTGAFGRPLRVLGIVAAVPAVASVVSLVWFQGAALILLGRLLCMVWTIAAAVSTARRLGR